MHRPVAAALGRCGARYANRVAGMEGAIPVPACLGFAWRDLRHSIFRSIEQRRCLVSQVPLPAVAYKNTPNGDLVP